MICSDTNVWIDFSAIGKLEYPFRLAFEYLIYQDIFDLELQQPETLQKDLLKYGVKVTEFTIEEFFLAAEINSKYPPLSSFDSAALAIAKCRNIPLLTGDKVLRKAAVAENVELIGTIKLCDLLYSQSKITQQEYVECLRLFLNEKSGRVRLPRNELEKRISNPDDYLVR